MYNNHPKTAEEYVELVEQTIIEIEEFIACIEYDMDDAGERLKVLQPLLEHLKSLRQSMADGSYLFGKEDLPIMDISNRLSSQLPFAQLLAVINETHKLGLNIDDD
ncbi:general secretion pathway protein GspF [Ectothiorhodospiraceae bacterium BW-2]|nr:general secretion pathway protein GspF [Ectothiorhodospiraceae bacterium BW-2]